MCFLSLSSVAEEPIQQASSLVPLPKQELATFSMIIPQSRLVVADNSGAKVAQCIGMLGAGAVARVGRIITVAIKASKTGSKIRPGEVHRGVLIRTRKEILRPDGRLIRFADNAVVLITKEGKPIGTKVNGPVPNELKKGGWLKVLSLSSRVL